MPITRAGWLIVTAKKMFKVYIILVWVSLTKPRYLINIHEDPCVVRNQEPGETTCQEGGEGPKWHVGEHDNEWGQEHPHNSGGLLMDQNMVLWEKFDIHVIILKPSPCW